jgi:D-alanyl-D-alanine carboxypeptidase (penicillin-binding protein 5/6)
VAGVLLAFSTNTSDAASDLARQLQPLIDAHDGQVGVAITHLSTGESFAHRANVPMPTASLIKFPLMVATYQAIEAGQLNPDREITLREADKVPGSGILTPHFSPGATISLRDAIQLMIVYSDNTATNLVADQVGLAATAKLMEDLDCPDTKLHSKVYRRDTSIFPQRSKDFGLGSTSAADMVKLLKLLNSGDLVSPPASEQMMEHLYACADDRMCKRNLPTDIKFAHKSGAVNAARTDAGIIDSPSGPIAICVLTAQNEDRSWSDNNAALVLGAKIAGIAYGYFNPDPSTNSGGPKQITVGSAGLLVEALQRTLNARTKPSVDIDVDGDFGPQTQGAVMTFQRQHDLPETGELDPPTWEALGPLITDEPDQPSPAEVNARVIEKLSADPLSGLPFVTAKAWAIGDADTGKLLWGSREDEPRDMASTTKIMTAYLVTSLAETDLNVLDEVVTCTRRADDTIGSTAGIRVGEKLPVRELLYGLLLPSGNDASVALAEHFGQRLSKDGESSYNQFIAAMNQAAHDLGMKKSRFENPNGLTAPKHKTSPLDLLTLAHRAMKQPLFRQIVGTVQHGCTVDGPGGYQRNLVWRNTNRLLRTQGYQGVKTGTTNAAGACLVSQGSRGNKSLIVVVLGASSSDARYADSRNLYRWAWHQLGIASGGQPR